ncbi:gem-associated protein 7 [Ambystoma mexicanum]|uniref:gem-associated protein 7 n=1 Tax=Ambystoma mexicanum TaxID=8296 RepID=UPI0037E90ED2
MTGSANLEPGPSDRKSFIKRPGDTAMKIPVSVIRLPRGPDGNSRGFDLNSPRAQALAFPGVSSSCTDSEDLKREQKARAMLREHYLRSLVGMAGKSVCFTMYEKRTVEACFGTSDIDILNFQVSNLQTPLGVQKEALIRCPDVISYSFEL